MPVKDDKDDNVKDDNVKSGDTVTVDKSDGKSDSSARQPRNSPLNIQRRDNVQDAADVDIARKTEVPPWERDDAPAGSTSSSLLTEDENGKPVVSGDTHYAHLANGRVVGSYGIGTHHTDADYNDGSPVAVATHFAG